MRYASNQGGSTALWLKDKTGWDLDPHQLIYVDEIKANNNCLAIAPPRAGKTVAMEAVDMEEMFTVPRSDLMMFAPKQDQANNALKYHLDWIEPSEILNSFIAFRRGKKQLAETKYELWNGSRAKTFGLKSNFDSENATIIRGEEYDDINSARWVNRVIGRGGRKNVSGIPTKFRLSGTIQEGQGNIFQTENSGNYKVLTKFDVYYCLAAGIYDKHTIDLARKEMTDDEWLRIYCLIYTEAKNFIWEFYLRECLKCAMEIGWEGIEYNNTGSYMPRGVVYAGFDMGHSGQKKQHSVYRMDIIEVLGDTVLWLNAREWESTTDPSLIRRDVVDYWRYYGVTSGYGDALKANDIAEINDALYDNGLISIDRSKNPENKPSDWNKWSFAPVWNTGKFKHLAGSITKGKIENRKFVIPYFDRKDDREIAKMALRLRRSLLNVRIVTNNSSYPTLEAIKPEIGDDPFDSINMAMACANDRNEMPIDFSKVRLSGQSTVTSGLRTSVISELQRVGTGMSFGDFN